MQFINFVGNKYIFLKPCHYYLIWYHIRFLNVSAGWWSSYLRSDTQIRDTTLPLAHVYFQEVLLSANPHWCQVSLIAGRRIKIPGNWAKTKGRPQAFDWYISLVCHVMAPLSFRLFSMLLSQITAIFTRLYSWFLFCARVMYYVTCSPDLADPGYFTILTVMNIRSTSLDTQTHISYNAPNELWGVITQPFHTAFLHGLYI